MLSPLDPLRLPLRLLEDVGRIAEAVVELPRITAAIDGLGDDLRGLRADLSSLPGDVKALHGMPEDLRGLRGEISGTPERILLMQAELDGLSGVLARVGQVLEETRDGIRPLDKDLASVERAVHELPPKLEELRNQLDGMRTDLSGLPFVSKS